LDNIKLEGEGGESSFVPGGSTDPDRTEFVRRETAGRGKPWNEGNE